MEPFIFVHLPKTAGTSFRKGCERYFGKELICYDYGPRSPETTDIVLEHIYEKSDFWRFFKAFKERGYRLIGGHFGASKYAPLFGVQRMITILREPVQRVVSEYEHFKRNYEYKQGLKKFYTSEPFINKQLRMLNGIPLKAVGFVGITEKYQDTLDMINYKYGLSIPLLEENKSMDNVHRTHELNENDENNILQLNASECDLFKKLRADFQQRISLFKVNKHFMQGMITEIKPDFVNGWAVYDNSDEPVEIQVVLNGEEIGTTLASEYRHNLHRIGIRRGGYVGFKFKYKELKSEDKIACNVAKTGQQLMEN